MVQKRALEICFEESLMEKGKIIFPSTEREAMVEDMYAVKASKHLTEKLIFTSPDIENVPCNISEWTGS